jgi:hypothetical protein
MAAFAFIGRVHEGGYAGAKGGYGGLGLVAALFPYLMSVLSSHAWVREPRRNVYAFLAVLVAGGLAAVLLTMGAFGGPLRPLALLGVYAAQTLLYLRAIGGLLLKTPDGTEDESAASEQRRRLRGSQEPSVAPAVGRDAATAYTDEIASFTDQFAAGTFAKFIASLGFSCDLVSVSGAALVQRYGVRVARSQIPDLRTALNLTAVENRLTPVAAQLRAGELARYGIPCYIGGEHTFGTRWDSFLTLDSLRTLKETNEPGDMVAVPASFFKQTMRVLNQKPLSEAELTKIALGSSDPAEPKDA